MFIHIRNYAVGVRLWSCMYNFIRDKELQGGSVGCYFFHVIIFQNDNKYDIHTYILFPMT